MPTPSKPSKPAKTAAPRARAVAAPPPTAPVAPTAPATPASTSASAASAAPPKKIEPGEIKAKLVSAGHDEILSATLEKLVSTFGPRKVRRAVRDLRKMIV